MHSIMIAIYETLGIVAGSIDSDMEDNSEEEDDDERKIFHNLLYIINS